MHCDLMCYKCMLLFDMYDYFDTDTLAPDPPTTSAFCGLPTFTIIYANLRMYCTK